LSTFKNLMERSISDRYRVMAIEDQIAKEVRRTGEAPGRGHPAFTDVATSYGPCRLCLRTFETGTDRRILFTYDPFEQLEPFPLPGPIYVHENSCGRHPEHQPIPGELEELPLTFNGYERGRLLHAQERTTDPREIETTIQRMLGRPDVDYIHVRNTEAGCYILRIERKDDGTAS
jgi:hypothetical protein